MNSIELKKLIILLEEVYDYKLDIESAEAIFKKIQWKTMPDIQFFFTNLHHFWHDEDIRSKDSYYKTMQELELKKLILHLKNENWVKANGVSFLDVSDT